MDKLEKLILAFLLCSIFLSWIPHASALYTPPFFVGYETGTSGEATGNCSSTATYAIIKAEDNATYVHSGGYGGYFFYAIEGSYGNTYAGAMQYEKANFTDMEMIHADLYFRDEGNDFETWGSGYPYWDGSWDDGQYWSIIVLTNGSYSVAPTFGYLEDVNHTRAKFGYQYQSSSGLWRAFAWNGTYIYDPAGYTYNITNGWQHMKIEIKSTGLTMYKGGTAVISDPKWKMACARSEIRYVLWGTNIYPSPIGYWAKFMSVDDVWIRGEYETQDFNVHAHNIATGANITVALLANSALGSTPYSTTVAYNGSITIFMYDNQAFNKTHTYSFLNWSDGYPYRTRTFTELIIDHTYTVN